MIYSSSRAGQLMIFDIAVAVGRPEHQIVVVVRQWHGQVFQAHRQDRHGNQRGLAPSMKI